MTLASLERRLAKIEARSHGDSPPFFLTWAAPNADLIAPVVAAIKAGRCNKGDPAFCFPWPYDDPVPAARWTTVHKISDAELKAIGDHQLAEYKRGIAEGCYAEPDPRERCPDDIVHMNDRALTAALLGLYVANYAEWSARERPGLY